MPLVKQKNPPDPEREWLRNHMREMVSEIKELRGSSAATSDMLFMAIRELTAEIEQMKLERKNRNRTISGKISRGQNGQFQITFER